MASTLRCLALPSILSLLAAACAAEGPAAADAVDDRAAAPAAALARARAGSLRFHTELVTGVRFPMPEAGVTVEERHFDPSLPSHKFKHSIRLRADGGTRVLIDVWQNPRGLALDAWFAEHLAFLVRDVTQVNERPMTRARLPGILLREPASEQAASQVIAVFAFRDQVFRVTGLDPEGDAAARDMFEGVVDQIQLGVTR